MDYPVSLEFDGPPEIARWRPLVHWLLDVPHLVIANVLSNLGGVIAIISWFAIVFTGRLPEGLANLQCLVVRYQARAYSYLVWLREPYPAFDFSTTPADPGGDPLRVDIRPQLESRNRLTVGLRLFWLLPAALYAMVIGIGAFFVTFAAFFAVLFTGRWPEGMRQFVIGALRVSVRVNSYAYLLVDDYPPFATT